VVDCSTDVDGGVQFNILVTPDCRSSYKLLICWSLLTCILCWWYSLTRDCESYRDGGRFIGNRYGAGSGPIWLNNVHCGGTETDMAHCRHSDTGDHSSCAHQNDVSVSCIAGILINSLEFKPPDTPCKGTVATTEIVRAKHLQCESKK